MFDGTTKKRSTVSLRGRSKDEDRSEFIRRARIERESRALERLQASCALTIQRFWRGRSRVGKERDRLRHVWDKKMHDLERLSSMLQAAGTPFQPPAPLLLSLLSQLLFFHVYPVDMGRLRSLSTFLQRALSPQSDARGAFFSAVDDAWGSADAVAQGVWLLRTTRLAALCLQYVRAQVVGDGSVVGHSEDVGWSGMSEMTVQLLVTLCNPEEWVASGVHQASASQLCNRMLLGLAVPRWGGRVAALLLRVSGQQARPVQLFDVLCELWLAPQSSDVASAGDVRGGVGVAGKTRLLCEISLRALGVGNAGGGAQHGARGLGVAGETAASSSDQEGPVAPEGARGSLPPAAAEEPDGARRAALRAFAAAMLPLPRLRDHPLWPSLRDPFLANSRTAWWELISVMDEEPPPLATPSTSPGEQGYDVNKTAWMLSNIVQLEGGELCGESEGARSCATSFVRFVHRLLQGLPLHRLVLGTALTDSSGAGVAGGDPMDLEVSDDEDALLGGGRGDAGAGISGVRLESIVRQERRRCAAKVAAGGPSRAHLHPDAAAAAAACVAQLAQPAMVGRLFDAILPPAPYAGEDRGAQLSSQGNAEEPQADKQSGVGEKVSRGKPGVTCAGAGFSGDEDPALALCSLYAQLLMSAGSGDPANPKPPASAPDTAARASVNAARAPAWARSILNSVAFSRPHAPIVARLWSSLRQTVCLQEYVSGSGSRAAPLGPALLLLCSAYSHQLLALDDEEFYERESPLSIKEVQRLLDFLKRWLCRLYWLDPVVPRLRNLEGTVTAQSQDARLLEAQLMLVATKLFNQLYERNSRRSFWAAEEWYWPVISAKELHPPDQDNMEGDELVYKFFYGSSNLALVLTNIPQVIPFHQRVAIFRRLMESEKAQFQTAAGVWNQASIRVRVGRESLYEDSFEQMNKLGSALKSRVQVTFVNEHGVEEAGIDGGGVFKEFMDSLTKRAFDPQYALFLATDDQLLYPNPASGLVSEDHLEHFEFLGRVLGKAVFEDILVEPQFSPVFLNKLLGSHNYIDDLYSLDPEVYRNLLQLKAYAHKGGDVADLSLTFSVNTSNFGETTVWDLTPGGRDVPVTNANVITYMHLIANFKLNAQTARQCKSFLRGFRDLIPVEWIRLFNPRELQMLIGGQDLRAVDVEELRENTRYAGGYHESQPVMQWFWNALRSFTPSEQGRYLMFVTSCSRPPLLGFKRLNPPMCVQKVPGGEDGERLPSSATCMNLLKLPEYRDQETLRSKLLYAINANSGFELT